MKSSHNSPRSLVLAALFLALGLVLPFLTGNIPQIGSMLCPMHFPVLLCGFILGAPYGLAVGFVTPLLRTVLFGMPPFPMCLRMAFELATYGLIAGLLYRLPSLRTRRHSLPVIYAVLLAAMVLGRIVWGLVSVLMAVLGILPTFSWQMFLSGALLTAIPGIIAQLVLIPLLLVLLQKANVMD